MTIEQLREEYKRVIGSDVSNRYKNNAEWMEQKIAENISIQPEEEKQEEVSSENLEPEAEEVVVEETGIEEEISVMKYADKIEEYMNTLYTEKIAPEEKKISELDTFVKVQKHYGFSMSDLGNTERLVNYFKVPEKHLELVHEYLVSITPKKENPIITKRGTRDYIRPLKEKYGLNSSDFFDEEKIRAKVFADLKSYPDKELAKAEKEAEIKAILQYSKAALGPIK